MKQGINKTAKQLADAQSAAAIASGNYTAASAAIAAVDAELRRIAELASAADAHHASLDGVVGAMEGLVEQNRALAQAATDLQTLLEKMHTESEQLDDQNTAETFAKAILEIGRLASSSQFLGTVMGDRAGEFEAAVARILGSPVDIDAAS
ncbi:uncharacterized protein PHACADRAFT_262774 [Phanerochaete carnosa HHB-10118-sp]|uniref:Uncharacterized protein n=1 Tax=Phanerochaete carnosa (strain HHB-10118-sp) TaxID=650164 RepID=K5VVS3_PHACS|nr:uncharacterized protein PHACADRAFT_262774 [Phanerochaete carnosa HHB-10118-sp]EKM50895.1 hypothetical protein PHACADRAFT_262774 [Phanerochaete carnosa HHB-10118-sp]